MKRRKNTRRVDPRYFLDETIEEIEKESNSARQERLKNHPDFHNFSFDSWLLKEAHMPDEELVAADLHELRPSSDELPSRKRRETTPGEIKAASDARERANLRRAEEEQKEKNRLSAEFNKRTLEEDEIEEGCGGPAPMKIRIAQAIDQSPNLMDEEPPLDE